VGIKDNSPVGSTSVLYVGCQWFKYWHRDWLP